MNYGQVQLSPQEQEFQAQVREFLSEVITPEVLDHERTTGDGFNEMVHLAFGKLGWLQPTWPVSEGGAGLGAVEERILDLELQRFHVPTILKGTTSNVWGSIAGFTNDAVRTDLAPRIADGTARICLGYTEPDGGSDIADAKLRAVSSNGGWVLNGAKMFTTGAHHATHCFLVARSNTEVSKHRGLTTFLVPMDSPGITVQPIRTYGGERTNATYFEDVFVDDRYRLGAVDGGWSVLMVPLTGEHGTDGDTNTLNDASFGRHYLRPLEEAINSFVEWAAKTQLASGLPVWSDWAVRDCIGRLAIAVEAAASAPAAAGRIIGAETLRDGASRLMDVLGPLALLTEGEEGAVCAGQIEFAHRFAQGTLTYGGSVEVFRMMITRELGLPRMRYPDGTA